MGLDPVGSLISILGLGSVVVGIIVAGRIGLARAAPLVGLGLALLGVLVWWIRR